MPKSYGFWLDPKTNVIHTVTTHQHWLLENASLLGLSDELANLDAETDQDPIRIIGVKAGLVRIRDYGRTMSIQFWESSDERIQRIYTLIRDFMLSHGVGPLKSVWINNLANGIQVTLNACDFIERVDSGAEIWS